jgi:hypothetical protein
MNPMMGISLAMGYRHKRNFPVSHENNMGIHDGQLFNLRIYDD